MSACSELGQPLLAQVFSSLKSTALYVGLLSFLLNSLMLTGPLFMLQVYDRVLASGSVPTLVVLGAFALGMYLFFGVLDGMRNRLLARIGLWIDAKLSGASYEVSTQAPLLLGDKAARLRPVQDMDSIRQFVCSPGPGALLDLPWLPFYLGLVFLLHPLLGVVALVGTLVICVLIGLNEYAARKPVAEFSQESARRATRVETARRNAEAVYAMGMMPALRQRWDTTNADYLDKQCVTSDRATLYGTAIKTFRFILQSLLLATGAWLSIKQLVTPGVMIAASIMSSRALAPIEQAVSQWRGFVTARQSLQRLKELLNAKPEHNTLALPLPCHHVHLVQFSCAPAGVRQPFVRNVSLQLQAGDALGIIGSSGSGKSTLARGMVGVLPALTGCVRFDGAQSDQWPDDKLGEFVGYLPQDVQLFDGTIAENISRFAEDPDPETVIAAAKMARVHDLIVTFPEGYNTAIQSGNLLLSGGQRQRIALARAVYKQPFFVVLDEPNSNLDAEGEQALTEAIWAMRAAGSIVVVIAHRPSAIAAVDRVLYLQEGQLRFIGPKQEVMQKVVASTSAKEIA